MIHRGMVADPPRGLVAFGPLVAVQFQLDPRDAAARAAAALPLPTSISGKVMIDTGAGGTHVFQSVPDQLGLVPIRYSPVIGVSGKSEDRPVYRLAVTIGMADARGRIANTTFAADMFGASTTFELPGFPEQVIGLLGRDFLAYFDFHYHGRTGEFEIVLPEAASQARLSDDEPKAKRLRKLARKSRKKNRR